MTSYTVEITEEALADMNQLYYYIAVNLKSPENAMGQYNRIAENILKLDIMPERHSIISSKLDHFRKIRIMPVDNYSIFYVIEDARVIVTNILYSASDIRIRLKK